MAVAKTRTLLSLDRYAKIMGINPVHFNGGSDIQITSGAVLFPLDNAQNNIWPQYSWQNFDQVSREDLALTIWNAEQEIMQYLGFAPTPIWIEAERHDLPTHYRPELRSVKMDRSIDGKDTSIKTRYAYFIRGGRRATTLLSAAAVLTYWDLDSDGFDEFAAVNVTVPATITDIGEIKVYFTGRAADPTYEIREPKSRAMAGNVLTIGFESWKLIDPDLYELYPTNDGTQGSVNMNDPASFVLTVDIYREYNDDTQDHVKFYSQDQDTAVITETGGYIFQNTSENFVMPIEGTYSLTDHQWARLATACVYPDYVDLWYYCGMRDRPGKHRYSNDWLNDDFAIAIAYLATARLERVFYANNNATALAASLRDNLTESERNGTFKMPPTDASTNPFGTRRGEFLAWRRIARYFTQRRAGGSL